MGCESSSSAFFLDVVKVAIFLARLNSSGRADLSAVRAVGVDFLGLLTGGSELGVAGADFLAVGGDDFFDDGGEGRLETGGDGRGGLSFLGSESGSGGELTGVTAFFSAESMDGLRLPIEAGVLGVPAASFTGTFTLPGDFGDLEIPPCAPGCLFIAAGVLAGPVSYTHLTLPTKA